VNREGFMSEHTEGLSGRSREGTARQDLPESRAGLFPYDSVVAVLDDVGEVRRTVDELSAAGIPEEEMFVLAGEQGVHAIDQRGEHHGVLGKIFKALDRVGDEHDESEVHVDALRQGSYVVGVHVRDDGRKTQAVEALKRHHGRHISYYGRWTTERVTP
jgi:hypothetical protein